MIDPGLRGKIVLVTGANSPIGIGSAIAVAFAAQGADVFLAYLRESPGMDGESGLDVPDEPGDRYYRARNASGPATVLNRLRSSGGRVGAMESDLAEPTSIPLLFDQVTNELGHVDILINNAAYAAPDRFTPRSGADDIGRRSIAEITSESHDRHFAVNSRAVALMMSEYANRHRGRGATWGRVINISTDAAECFPGEVSYGASKAALESYSRSAAVELGALGITVNIIAPGPIQTGWIPSELESLVAADTPLGRVGEPDDIADVAVFLASEQARWVTGQRIFVGGGHRMI